MDGKADENLPLLSEEPTCVSKIKDDVTITPCYVCSPQNESRDHDVVDRDDGHENASLEWQDLPDMFAGIKGMATTINVPVVPKLDFEDLRFAHNHIGT